MFEVIYKNRKTGQQYRCGEEEWEAMRKHKTLRKCFALVRKVVIPQAAAEAIQASFEEE